MKNLSKFVAVALIALSTACAQTQEETAAAAPAPTVEETNTEESSADNENAEPAEAVTDAAPDKTKPRAASSSKPKLDLPTQCLQPRIAGRCKARFSVFGFDPLKGKCVPYFYGGCEGSENRFDTLEACNEACNPPANQAAKK